MAFMWVVWNQGNRRILKHEEQTSI